MEITVNLKSAQKVKDEAIRQLALGQLVAMPTETVYGLGADSLNDEAVQKIYQVKGRPSHNPLIAHVSDIEMAELYCQISPLERRLMEKYWPGPLTIVLPLREEHKISKYALAGHKTVAVRSPRGIFRDIIAEFGKPIVAPSANKSGHLSPTKASHVRNGLGDKVALIIDGGDCNYGLESTIIRCNRRKVELLRAGAVSAQEIADFIGPDYKLDLMNYQMEGEGKILAPGMLSSHYAPRAKLRLNIEEVKDGEALLAFASQDCRNIDKAKTVLNLSSRGDLYEAAHNLFDYLYQLDQIGVSSIAVQKIPAIDIGLAINDRLRRAAAPRQ